VVGALHDNDVLLLGGRTRELDGRLDRLGARVPEEERVERRVWQDGEQVLDELDLRRRESNVDLFT
jgi:hypothetical protein